MSIELPPDVQRRLAQEAERRGISHNEYAVRLIEEALPDEAPAPAAPPNLFARWAAEGEAAWEAMTPDERAQAEAELAQFKRRMNENRAGQRLLYPWYRLLFWTPARSVF